MSIATDIADFRFDNGIDTSQLTDANALRYYNDIRDTVIDRIVQEKEDYFYNEFTVDLVIGKREYLLPKRGDLAEDGVTVLDGIKKIKNLGIKYSSTETDYSKLRLESSDNLDKDILSYSDTVSPFYVLSDNSVFLYPTPNEDVDAWLIVYAISQPKKVILTDTETLPDFVKKIILLWMGAKVNEVNRKFDVSSVLQARFDKELSRIGISLSGRVSSPKEIKFPNLGAYCK